MTDTLYIDYKISDMLENLFPGYTHSTTLGSYGFNYISFSPSDPTRLSGIAVNLNLPVPTKEERRRKGTLLKPGKFLRAVYPDLDRDTVAMMGEKLAKELMKSSPEVENVVVIDTPSAVYCMDHGEKGELGGSCMRGCNKNYFEMYDVNPNTKMAYLCNKEGSLIGRALLHEEVHSEDFGTIKLMDRIYVANGNIMTIFKEWARNNGYWHKYLQNSEDTDDIVNPEDGRSHCTKLTIQLEEGRKYRRVPYMDSFKYFHKDYTLTTRSMGSIDTMEGTEGDSYENRIVLFRVGYCLHCGRDVMSDEEGYFSRRRGAQVVCPEHAHLYALCSHCNSVSLSDTIKSYELLRGEVALCDDCAENELVHCADCGGRTLKRRIQGVFDSEGHKYLLCGECMDNSTYHCLKHSIYHMDEKCHKCLAEEEDRINFLSVFEDLQLAMPIFNIHLEESLNHAMFSHRGEGERTTAFELYFNATRKELSIGSDQYFTALPIIGTELVEKLVLAIVAIEKMLLDDAEEAEERARQMESRIARITATRPRWYMLDEEVEIIPAERR